MGWDWKEIDNALTSKGVVRTCPACEDQMSAPVAEYFLVRIDANDELEVSPPEGVRLFALVCPNCGYLRLHSPNVLSGKKLRGSTYSDA